MHLTDDEFAELIRKAVDELPEQFTNALGHVVIDVQDVPDEQTAERMRIGRHALLGLYQGTPLPAQSVEHILRMPARIVLYKQNIENFCGTRERAVKQIHKTLLHEIGHHFGMNESDLRELGYG